jgi:GNAT superfamily N-acetyltransferase
MPDMLVKLYDLDFSKCPKEVFEEELRIIRVLTPDNSRVVSFVRDHFSEGWACECEKALHNNPATCFAAVHHKTIVGFGCYDATARGYFGPTGVIEPYRQKGIGKALLISCLMDMWDHDYGYAIIGWTSEASDFYKRTVGATTIEGSTPGIYKRLIDSN